MRLDGTPYALARMTLDDVLTIAEIEHIVFSMPWSASTFSYELRNNPSSEYLTLRYIPWAHEPGGKRLLPRPLRRLLPGPKSERAVLGYGGFWMLLEEAHICTLGLRPEWRGRGLGELLLAVLIERALERQAEVVTLEVRVSNNIAQNLYLKYGFKTVGRRKGYYSDNHEDALIMTIDSIVSAEYQQRFGELTTHLYARLRTRQEAPRVVQDARASREHA